MTSLLLVMKLQNRITYGLLDALLIIHTLTFLIPVFTCVYPQVTAIYMATLMGVNFLFLILYSTFTFFAQPYFHLSQEASVVEIKE